MACPLIVRLSCLTGTHSWVPMIPYMRLLWSNFCIYAFMLLFSFSIFSDRRSLKIENENNSTKTLKPHIEDQRPKSSAYNIETYPGWLELPLTGINFRGPKPVRATEVLLYFDRCFLLKIKSLFLQEKYLFCKS